MALFLMASTHPAPHIADGEERRMAGGWTRDGAVQDQIDDTVADAVLAARASMPTGGGASECIICGDEIPEGRRLALPGARTCVTCQSGRDRPLAAAFNRRGSKDSQLR
ncbi:MAG: DksA/TraR family C4-type zinc finger protein [Janthinobacterium lividum]